MTQADLDKLNAQLAAILTTLFETRSHSAIESTLYMGLGMSMARWEQLRLLLVTGRLVTIKGRRVTLTQLGRQAADKCMLAATGK